VANDVKRFRQTKVSNNNATVLSLRIKYSMRDIICGVNYHTITALWRYINFVLLLSYYK